MKKRINLQPLTDREQTQFGLNMMHELGYTRLRELGTHFSLIDPEDKSSILVRRDGGGKYTVFSYDDQDDELQGLTSEMIMALAEIFKGGTI